MKKFLVFTLLLSITANQVICTNNEPKKPTKEATQAQKSKKQRNIEKIIELTVNKDHMLAMMQNISDQISKQFEAQIPADQAKELKAPADIFFKKFLNEFTSEDTTKKLTAIYDKHYSEKEVEDLLKFYESETGKKMLQKLPEVTGEIASISSNMVQKHINEYISELGEIQKKFAPAKEEVKEKTK